MKNFRTNKTHLFFWGSVFSNFYPCSFTYKGLSFTSSEQAFMWAKARHFGDVKQSIKILDEHDPKKCKHLGRQVSNFDDKEWEKVSYSIMVNILVAKFSQNENLKKQLLDNQHLIFVEGSPFDKKWGVGLHWQSDEILNEANWKGQNLLGKALNEIANLIEVL